MSWITPTSHNDPNDKWLDPTQAYDDNVATWSRNWDPDEANYLELIHAAISCSKVRIRGNEAETNQANAVYIAVYYSGAYHTILTNGSLAVDAYTEVEIGSTQTVTKAKIWKAGTQLYLREFDFWQIEGWSGKVSGVTNPAKVLGVVKASIKKVMGVE